jgi:integrase
MNEMSESNERNLICIYLILMTLKGDPVSTIRGLYRRFSSSGEYTWHIDKYLKRFGLLCENTGTSDPEEAERYLLRRIHEIREIALYGSRPRRKFHEAAAKYLADFARKSTITRDAAALKDLLPYIGDSWLDQINNDSFNAYRNARQDITIATRNGKMAVARRILKLAAEVWCYPNTNMTWLERAPAVLLEKGHRPRDPYPLDATEQELLFSELPPERRQIALFAVNTGLRDQELCRLQWSWEIRVPELDTPTLKRSVFVLPADFVKGKRARVVILNDFAQAILEDVRGQHRRYVFTSKHNLSRRRLNHVIAASWRNARVRASQRYMECFGVPAPEGFQRIRVHDLRHTFGRRLRAAGVGLEDRQDLLGHKRREITTHYSAGEVGQLIASANRVLVDRGPSSTTLFRVIASSIARPHRVSRGSHKPRVTSEHSCLSPAPQNSRTHLMCVRDAVRKSLVRADGIEPPTFAL